MKNCIFNVFGNIVAQNRPSGNNINFLQHYFPLRCGRSLCCPMAALMNTCIHSLLLRNDGLVIHKGTHSRKSSVRIHLMKAIPVGFCHDSKDMSHFIQSNAAQKWFRLRMVYDSIQAIEICISSVQLRNIVTP